MGEDVFSEFAGAGNGDGGDERRSVGTAMNEMPRLAPKKIADDVIPRTLPRITVFEFEAMLMKAPDS
jgi:hypothetical protein